jgi:hypothetical protein
MQKMFRLIQVFSPNLERNFYFLTYYYFNIKLYCIRGCFKKKIKLLFVEYRHFYSYNKKTL